VCRCDTRYVCLSFSSSQQRHGRSHSRRRLRSIVPAVPPQAQQPFHASPRELPRRPRVHCILLAHLVNGVHLLCRLIQPPSNGSADDGNVGNNFEQSDYRSLCVGVSV